MSYYHYECGWGGHTFDSQQRYKVDTFDTWTYRDDFSDRGLFICSKAERRGIKRCSLCSDFLIRSKVNGEII